MTGRCWDKYVPTFIMQMKFASKEDTNFIF